jgi:flavin reductase (DIM6/NTAB) family NADH-FMN oxidoreductase RutF
MEEVIEDTGSCSGRDVDKFEEFGLKSLKAREVKSPLLSDCIVNLECKLEDELEAGDHTIFLGRVVAAYVDDDIQSRLLNFSGKFAPAILQEY